MEKKEPLLNVRQVAEKLGVRPATVYAWVYSGVLPHVGILAGFRRRVVRFREHDIDGFIARHVVASRGRR